MYVKISDDGYVAVTSDTPLPDGLPEAVDLPEDFKFDYQNCYRLTDGAPVLDEAKYAEMQKPPPPEPDRIGFIDGLMEGYDNG